MKNGRERMESLRALPWIGVNGRTRVELQCLAESASRSTAMLVSEGCSGQEKKLHMSLGVPALKLRTARRHRAASRRKPFT
jgi:hypothetical protein